MQVPLVDGTYELFRYFFALPGHLDDNGVEVDAVRGVLGSVLGLAATASILAGVAAAAVLVAALVWRADAVASAHPAHIAAQQA